MPEEYTAAQYILVLVHSYVAAQLSRDELLIGYAAKALSDFHSRLEINLIPGTGDDF